MRTLRHLILLLLLLNLAIDQERLPLPAAHDPITKRPKRLSAKHVDGTSILADASGVVVPSRSGVFFVVIYG
jgi:hypothetical protein